MKKILFAAVMMFFGGNVFALTEVQESAGKAFVGAVSVSSFTPTAISTNVVNQPFAYNICNEDSTNKIRCGYSVSVSTVSGSIYQGFWVKPQECEYRAVNYGIVPYCQAEGSSAINVVREIFGKYQ